MRGTWTAIWVFPKDKLAGSGTISFPRQWVDGHNSLGKHVALRRIDRAGGKHILATQVMHVNTSDIAISSDVFNNLATLGEVDAVAAEFRDAPWIYRAWNRKKSRLDLIVALLTFAAACATAYVAFAVGVSRVIPGIPDWLVVGALLIAGTLAVLKLVKDVRNAD
jgi:hypothetical protein